MINKNQQKLTKIMIKTDICKKIMRHLDKTIITKWNFIINSSKNNVFNLPYNEIESINPNFNFIITFISYKHII